MQTYNLMKSGLNAAQLRSKTIANNIANINTPNYKRKYVKFEETLNKLNKSIDILKTSGWDSAASEEFFNTFDNKWKYNMELLIKILNHFKECIKSSQEDYKKLDELIQTTLKSLQL